MSGGEKHQKHRSDSIKKRSTHLLSPKVTAAVYHRHTFLADIDRSSLDWRNQISAPSQPAPVHPKQKSCCKVQGEALETCHGILPEIAVRITVTGSGVGC
jgi:hypothetical protein